LLDLPTCQSALFPGLATPGPGFGPPASRRRPGVDLLGYLPDPLLRPGVAQGQRKLFDGTVARARVCAVRFGAAAARPSLACTISASDGHGHAPAHGASGDTLLPGLVADGATSHGTGSGGGLVRGSGPGRVVLSPFGEPSIRLHGCRMAVLRGSD